MGKPRENDLGETNCTIQPLNNLGQAPVVRKVDNAIAIHWINLNPVDDVIGFPNIYLLDSDLCGG